MDEQGMREACTDCGTNEGWQFKLEIYDLSEEIGDDSLDRPRFLMSRAENKRLN